ncbi:hypothetical protein C450_00982 [Halococcus salifodinae DSM 8989]|uniref:Uncharacterized protein n=1 Tax=Halococcus salifodinae DSM 8989 TaxID=1227456 RepID=M0NDT0_9EURY|nr:hypothetical protein C450_00982 [Halococcus salifodinae DSM 8989]
MWISIRFLLTALGFVARAVERCWGMATPNDSGDLLLIRRPVGIALIPLAGLIKRQDALAVRDFSPLAPLDRSPDFPRATRRFYRFAVGSFRLVGMSCVPRTCGTLT